LFIVFTKISLKALITILEIRHYKGLIATFKLIIFVQKMKHISILVPNGQYSIVNIAGTLQILEAANEMAMREYGKQLFNVELIAAQNPAKDLKGLYLIYPTKTLSEIQKTDLIIVPAVHADIDQVLKVNKDTVKWIKEHYKNGSEVASFCIGIYLLAEAGILTGKVCSTHWAHVQKLKLIYPHLDVRDENFITDDNGVYTSGGAYGFTNLLLYLIEKFAERKLAVQIAKVFMIDMDKGSQASFMMFSDQKNHNDDVVLQVQCYIESHYDSKFTVNDLVKDHAIIRRTLERRFKKALGTTINEYIQRVRVEAAKEGLEERRKTVNEVMYEVGYNDSKAFRDVFKKHTGISPLDYRQKFGSSNIKMVKN
jgi:transcriptional regulator GlxA family with amidase domain